MRIAAVLIALIALPLLSQTQAWAKDALEGKWEVTLVPDNEASTAGAKEFTDTLEFKGSKFESEAYKKEGFEAVVYEGDTRRFGPAKFTAVLKSEKLGEAEWKGFVSATSIEGTLVRTKKDGTILNYTFKGEKKDK